MASALTAPALVLNRSWIAIQTTTVRKALGMLYTGVAEAIGPDTYETHDFDSWSDLSVDRGEPHIATVRRNIRVPEVIRLNRFEGFPRHRVPFTRKNLYRRDAYTCQYCGTRPGSGELSIDHILPTSRGGRSDWTNCVLACLRCNKRKANQTPTEAGLRLLNRPRRPRWSPRLTAPTRRKPRSWDKFVSDCYWNVELQP
jgi:5-methylcytosine-specific restriction endonuclease McrA